MDRLMVGIFPPLSQSRRCAPAHIVHRASTCDSRTREWKFETLYMPLVSNFLEIWDDIYAPCLKFPGGYYCTFDNTFMSTWLHALKLACTTVVNRGMHVALEEKQIDRLLLLPCLLVLNSLRFLACRLLDLIATSALYPLPLRKAFTIMQRHPIRKFLLRMLCWLEQ